MATERSYSEYEISLIWEQANKVPGIDPTKYRKDVAGAWIERSAYGNCKSKLGWEVDHKKPISKSGSENISNLRPLQWENNRSKCDDYPTWIAVVTASGNQNVDRRQQLTIS
ncbi:MAG: HNH endonuclease signature motif containing protein [Alphaproteobacteria bacterium]